MSLLTFAKNGQQQTYTPSFESIAQLLGEHARKFPGKEALIGINVDTAGQYSISYEKLQEMAMQTANFLFGKGIRKGDRIAFLFHNTPEILILELAAGFIGASSVPLDSKRDTTERKIFKLKDANVKILFSSVDEQNEEEAARIAKTLPSLGSVVLTNENPLWQRVGDQPVAPDFAMNDSVESEYVLLYTSGTTANPKGVPLTLRACFANAEGICQWQKLSSEDRFLIVLPLHHVNSTIMSLATLVAGGTIILSSRYSASKFWDIVENRRATITSVVPTILHDLLARKEEFFVKSRDLSSLKRILVGSAPVLPKETMRFMETFGVNVVQGYGQTETALRVTGVPINLSRESHLELTKKNSIGKELAFCNVAILRHDGSQADENEEGEICIRGPVLGDGYLNNPEETDKTFSQGWFHSGDLGFYQMVNGDTYFFIKGRIKEIIIKGGIKISPAAVEDALLKNFPEIDEVCVVGYSDARMGEEVAALIRLDQNSRKEQERETKRRILEDGGLGKLDGLSRYECPTKVFILKEEIPKTYTGKIQRVKAKEMIAEWVRHEEAAHYYCRLIQATEARALQQAVEINNQRWGLPSSAQEFEVRARNGYVIGVFDEHERLRGTLSALRISEENLYRVSTWKEATGNGTLSTHDPNGNVLLCISISVEGRDGEKFRSENLLAQALLDGTWQSKPEYKEAAERLAQASVDFYAKTDLDNVLRFHRKPKGGMDQGAKVVKILAHGRPEDADALSYNMLVEYPELTSRTKIIKSKNAQPSVLLIEQSMLLAKEKGCGKVIAFSRPAQFGVHLAKALDGSIGFEVSRDSEFSELSNLVRAQVG